MPKMILKVEGKGNGIKTNIVNLSLVAKALRVPVQCKISFLSTPLLSKSFSNPILDPLRFFGAELGTQFEYKEKQNHLSIVNGKVDYPTMLKLLDKYFHNCCFFFNKRIRFIDKFVLCPTCKIPEISLRVKKGLIQGKCAACGEIEKLENSHKVCNHMIKNPPKNLTEFSQKYNKISLIFISDFSIKLNI
jgi:translation initiation factor 5